MNRAELEKKYPFASKQWDLPKLIQLASEIKEMTKQEEKARNADRGTGSEASA